MEEESGIPLLRQDSPFRRDCNSDVVCEGAPRRRRGLVLQSLPVKRLVFSSSRLLRLATLRPLGVRCGNPASGSRRALILLLNCTVPAIFILVVVSISDALLHPSYSSPPAHYRTLENGVYRGSAPGRGNPRNEQVFIASNIIQADLIRNSWGPSLIRLVELLGPDNVFVSIYENDSGPSTKEALDDLGSRLQCERSIVTGVSLPLSEFPSITLPDGRTRVKRLTYLANLRNRLLQPLDEAPLLPIAEESRVNHTDRRFDRILFLNDVYFDPVEALHLMFSTNVDHATQRSEYDVACAADFVASVMFYDTFVVRDLEGYGMGLMFFPWFTGRGRGDSRSDVLAEKDAVRVRSCWGGMASFAAAPFLRGSATGGTEAPLRFRHQGELYWEASECCLINADVAARTPTPKIFLNPYVRVAYDPSSWSWLPFIRRIERVFVLLQFIVSAVGYPEYNPRRTEQPGQISSQERWVYTTLGANGEKFRDQNSTEPVKSVRGRWKVTEEVALPGGFCGQRRLFIMKPDLQEANGINNQNKRNWEKGPWPR